MNSLIVAAPRGTTVKRFADLARVHWDVQDEEPTHCLILKDSSHVILNADDSIGDDYDADDMALVRRVVPDPTFFMFESNDIRFGTLVLAALIDAEDVVVDDDHGNIVAGVEFVLRLRSVAGCWGASRGQPGRNKWHLQQRGLRGVCPEDNKETLNRCHVIIDFSNNHASHSNQPGSSPGAHSAKTPHPPPNIPLAPPPSY